VGRDHRDLPSVFGVEFEGLPAVAAVIEVCVNLHFSVTVIVERPPVFDQYVINGR
jgi:hypothetical protein